MRVLGIIPSRYGSSRFPGKPLADIAGKTMIQRVYEQASKSNRINELIVATDDDRIFDHVKGFGGHAMMTSDQHQSGTERCGEVIYKWSDFDVVINIQGDEPLIEPEQIEKVIALFEDPEVNIGTLVRKVTDVEEIRNPNRIKVVLDDIGNGIYFSRSPIPHIANVPHDEWLSKADFYRHIGIYGWRLNCLKDLLQLEPTLLEKQESLEQLRWLYHGYKIRTAETFSETPNIDVPDDVKAVLAMLGG